MFTKSAICKKSVYVHSQLSIINHMENNIFYLPCLGLCSFAHCVGMLVGALIVTIVNYWLRLFLVNRFN